MGATTLRGKEEKDELEGGAVEMASAIHGSRFDDDPEIARLWRVRSINVAGGGWGHTVYTDDAGYVMRKQNAPADNWRVESVKVANLVFEDVPLDREVKHVLGVPPRGR